MQWIGSPGQKLLASSHLYEMDGDTRSKRFRAPPVRSLLGPSEIFSVDEEVSVLELRFQLDSPSFYQLPTFPFAAWLKELHINPPYEDRKCLPLDLTRSGIQFPSLEKLSIQNQAIQGIILNDQVTPHLRFLKISHPLGYAISSFQIYLPNSLEEVHLDYVIIHDGRGLAMSLDTNTNPHLKVVNKFATTVMYCGTGIG